MRVVLDANVLVSFLLTRGPTISTILSAWRNKQFTTLISNEVLLEVQEVLERFVGSGLIQKEEAGAFLQRLRKESEIVPNISVVTISKDKKDNRYLACAKDGNADFLVTGDKKDLLPLKRFGKTKIISPRKFIEIIERRNMLGMD